MKKLITILMFLPSLVLCAPKLICDIYYVTYDQNGNRISRYLSEGHVEEAFESQYGSASFMLRTKELVDAAVYVDGERIEASLGYQDRQSSFGGLIKSADSFTVNLYFRKEILINNEVTPSLNLQCVIME